MGVQSALGTVKLFLRLAYKPQSSPVVNVLKQELIGGVDYYGVKALQFNGCGATTASHGKLARRERLAESWS
jgi:hypothetical protein